MCVSQTWNRFDDSRILIKSINHSQLSFKTHFVCIFIYLFIITFFPFYSLLLVLSFCLVRREYILTTLVYILQRRLSGRLYINTLPKFFLLLLWISSFALLKRNRRDKFGVPKSSPALGSELQSTIVTYENAIQQSKLIKNHWCTSSTIRPPVVYYFFTSTLFFFSPTIMFRYCVMDDSVLYFFRKRHALRLVHRLRDYFYFFLFGLF